MLKKLPYARTDDTAALSGHVYISHFWRDSGGTVHHTSVMSCVYFLVGRIFHPQTQLTFLTKEWGWRKSPKPITTPRVHSKVLKKRHYAPADDTEERLYIERLCLRIFPMSEEILHHSSVMSFVYCLVGWVFHPQTQLVFQSKRNSNVGGNSDSEPLTGAVM